MGWWWRFEGVLEAYYYNALAHHTSRGHPYVLQTTQRPLLQMQTSRQCTLKKIYPRHRKSNAPTNFNELSYI